MLRFATGIAPWLPGISAAARLGIDDTRRESIEHATVGDGAEMVREQAHDSERLPPREDAFYLSLMHSHL